jgi:hypothetical protein
MRLTQFLILLLALGCRIDAQDLETSIQQADQMERSGHNDDEIRLLEQANASKPNDPQIEKRLARCYTRKVDDFADPETKRTFADKSLALAGDAAEKLRNDAEAHLGLAAAYGKLCELADQRKRFEYARQVYIEAQRGLSLDPDNDYGHLILALWNVELATTNPVLRMFGETAYGRLPTASTKEALSQFRRAIELAPERVIHHAEYAKALEVLGEKEASREQWAKLASLPAIDSQDHWYQLLAGQHLRADDN